jgi:hypothetical protein
MHALEFNTPTTPPTKTIVAFHSLHPLAKVDLTPFVNDFHLETNLGLDIKTFIFVLTHSPHLSSNGPSNMVYELLHHYFVPNDFVRSFEFFLNMWAHYLWSYSSINITPTCCIVTIGFG